MLIDGALSTCFPETLAARARGGGGGGGGGGFIDKQQMNVGR